MGVSAWTDLRLIVKEPVFVEVVSCKAVSARQAVLVWKAPKKCPRWSVFGDYCLGD